MELNTIYNEECIDGMKRITDGSVDMILCDLPYGTTRNKWDEIIPFDLLWAQYNRVIKDNGAIVLTAQTPFDKVLGSSNIKNLKYEWIWRKENGTGFLNAKKMPLKDHENVLVFYKKLPTYNPQMRTGFKPYIKKGGGGGGGGGGGSSNYNPYKDVATVSDGERFPLTSLMFKRDKDKIHPTQKPVALFEYLIKTYTNEGEIVLDNCMGSGTTAIACMNTNRNFIGFELDKEYYDKSIERINIHRKELV